MSVGRARWRRPLLHRAAARGLALAFGVLTAIPVAGAQSVAARLAAGDSAYDANHLTAALQQFEAVIALEPTNYRALWEASEIAVSLGEFEPNEHIRDTLFAHGSLYGGRAVAANGKDAEGHFALARALGRIALALGPRDAVKYASEVRIQGLAALGANPKHAGALHVMGLWNENIMQLGMIERLLAKTLLGASSFNAASWDEAQRYLEEATAIEPNRILHHLDLGHVYAERKRTDQARAQFQLVLSLPSVDYNDGHYKQDAAAALKALKP